MNTLGHRVVGLLINPVAGLGGRVGLKGSDGVEIQQKALSLGAKPIAPTRVAEALAVLYSIRQSFDLYVAAGEMGECVAKLCGFSPVIVYYPDSPITTAMDTIRAAEVMLEKSIDILLFAGGDGTARDVCTAIGSNLPVLGIPAGVKIYSAVFAINPRSAGHIVREYLTHPGIGLEEAEVIDLDEEAYRSGVVRTRLYGFLRIPKLYRWVQNKKVPTSAVDRYQIEAIATQVIELMKPNQYYALGPGSIPNAIARLLGIKKTIVGVDLIMNNTLFKEDVGETQLLEVLNNENKLGIVVTPIGGQGFLFGRGNQQFSPRILEKISREDLLVVSLPEKIQALQGRPLLVDTGDIKTDQKLSGYIRVITGYREAIIYPVAC